MPGVRLLVAGNQAQQGRLAIAIATDDANAVASADAQRDIVEHGATCIALPD